MRALPISFFLLFLSLPATGQEPARLDCTGTAEAPVPCGPEPAGSAQQGEAKPPESVDRNSASTTHRLSGNACYYSSFFHGRKTASGEIYRNDRFSAAHLTLPLGTLVEVQSRATGKKLRLRVNDRGPYSGGFVIDLSRAAAKEIGVDKAADRMVEVRVLALPGEQWKEEEEEVTSEE